MIYHTDCKVCGGSGYRLEVIDGYETFLECACIQPQRIRRYLYNSGIRYGEYEKKSLNTFREDTEEARRMKAIAKQFLADGKATGMGFFGKPGTGKTHICIAACQEYTRKQCLPHHYFSYRREIQRLKAVYYEAEPYGRLMERWQTCQMLYMDDLLKFAQDARGGFLGQELQILYDIINARYINRVKTIFSSEYTVSELCEIDSALGSRIYEMISPYGMKCEGKNRRIAPEKKAGRKENEPDVT